MYQILDAPLLRASTHPADMDLPAWPDLTRDISPGQVREWLSAVWSRVPLADAITMASPDLATQVARICAGRRLDPRQLRRTVAAVGRYLLRMGGRSAPFGLFAGVAPAPFGEDAAVRWGHDHRAVARIDGTWLAEIITALEGCPPLLRRLPVVVNDVAEVRDDRVVLPCQRRPGDGGRRGDAPLTVEISLRYTAAVAKATAYARSPIMVGDLLDRLRGDFPAAAPSAIESVIGDLVRHRVLVTALRTKMTTANGLAELLAQLAAAGADDVPAAADMLGELRNAAERLGVDRGGRSVHVDLRLDADVVLPRSLVRHATAVAGALTRLSPYPHGLAAWREYHAAFLDRYGVGAVVPLLELVNPDVGLGYPATYRDSDRTAAEPALSDRDRGLLRLAQNATMGGGDELALDDRAIAELVGPDAPPATIPPHIELFLQVHATSDAALRQDRYTLAVTGASRAAGATVGRFLHLFNAADQARFRTAYSSIATLRAGAVPVQVSMPPLRESSNNLASAPQMLPAVLSAGEFVDGDDVIRIEDVAVSGDIGGLYFVSLRDRRLIEPTVLNAVEFRYFSHPLTRLLCELPRACAAVYMPFSWGAAAFQTFLPRVRYGRTVLSAARWNLVADDLPPVDTPWPAWRDTFATWCERFRVPEHVCLVEADNLLPLDLGTGTHLQILRTHLDRHGQARLDEAPSADTFGWLGGHAHEIVIPLTSTVPPQPDPLSLHIHLVVDDQSHLPGSGSTHWLYAKLYTSAARVLDLAHQFRDLMIDVGDEWWYLPYNDPDPHLRLRVRLPDASAYGAMAACVGGWATQLRQDRLVSRLQLDTYVPETGRYGSGDAMRAAERVFAADSGSSLAELRAIRSGVLLDALTAASLVNLAVAFIGETATAMTWLVTNLSNEAAPTDRATLAEAVRMADPGDDWAAICEADPTGEILNAWQRRHAALAAYREQLARERDPLSVLPSLLHLHSIRINGIDPGRERLTGRLARAAALRWTVLNTVSTP